MMLRFSFDLEVEARAVEAAVDAVLEDGVRTGDISNDPSVVLGTREIGEAIVAKILA